MPSNEEGELELVLGNKQLLSVFFLVVLLLGVFFSMGYIVGRNTAPATSLSASNRQPPLVVESARGTVPVPDKPSAVAPKTGAVKPQVEPPPPPAASAKTEPPKAGKAEAKPEPPKPAVVAKVEPPKPEPAKKAEPAKVDPPKPAAVAAAKGGTFLQVVATKRPDADKVVATLAAKGFPASISPVPDSTLVRVVVGPLGDGESVSRTRSGLEAAGYKPIVRKF